MARLWLLYGSSHKPSGRWPWRGAAIKCAHGTGLCNMPLFYAAEKNLFDKYGIDDDVVMTPMAGTSAIQ